jgi:hypothetical protein
MKKALLALVALTLILAVAGSVLGCNNGSTSSGPKKSPSPSPSGEKTFVITLIGNFQYGDGYQYNVEDAKLMGGTKIAVGDTFTLEIEFKGDRDLTATEGEINMGFADGTPEADYWTALTWEDDDMEKVEGKDLTAGKSGTYNFTALVAATAATPKANLFNIQFKSPDDMDARPSGPGATGSGTTADASYNPNPVKLTFTKFILKKTNAPTWEHDLVN